MNAASLATLKTMTQQRIFLFTPVRTVMIGVGFAYATEKEKYWHLPISFVFPGIYFGYQGYKNRESILKRISNL